MSKREAVGSNYLDSQKAMHGHKQLPPLGERRALVVGSNQGNNIGAGIGRGLRRSGIFGEVHEPSSLALDVREWESIEAYLNGLQWAGELPDLLVLSQGYLQLDWVEEASPADLDKTIEVNLTGAIRLVQGFVQLTIDAEHKKQIILIGSMAYKSVLNGGAAYGAAKAGLAQFSRSIAWELAPKGFDVFCVHPSNTQGTPMTRSMIEQLEGFRGLSPQEAFAYWAAGHPRTEHLTPDDISETVIHLASGKSRFLAGAQLELGGGQRG